MVEALRIAWGDRLRWFGDPKFVDVPVERLLSDKYAKESAQQIKKAIAEKRPVPVTTDGRTAGGTVNLSAVDAQGNMAVITLTHGDSFGARVTVDGLGLLLGHGMSRFEPAPGKLNSIAPGKRPLDNMCPSIVLKGGRPVVALGGVGGRRIPNASFPNTAANPGQRPTARRFRPSAANPHRGRPRSAHRARHSESRRRIHAADRLLDQAADRRICGRGAIQRRQRWPPDDSRRRRQSTRADGAPRASATTASRSHRFAEILGHAVADSTGPTPPTTEFQEF